MCSQAGDRVLGLTDVGHLPYPVVARFSVGRRGRLVDVLDDVGPADRRRRTAAVVGRRRRPDQLDAGRRQLSSDDSVWRLR